MGLIGEITREYPEFLKFVQEIKRESTLPDIATDIVAVVGARRVGKTFPNASKSSWNRPYRDFKEAGLIIDYVDIPKEFTRAFENYTEEDITGVPLPIEKLTEEFTQTLNQTMNMFQDIPADKDDRQTMLKAFETIKTTPENTEKFQQNYQKLRCLFELLGAHPIKLENLNQYKWLTQLYGCYIHWLRRERCEEYCYIRKYYLKTLKSVYKTTEIEEIQRLQNRQKQLAFTNLQYAILLTLEQNSVQTKT